MYMYKGKVYLISDKRLLIFRSSFRAAMAATCPLPPELFLDKFSNESAWPRSCWKPDSITCPTLPIETSLTRELQSFFEKWKKKKNVSNRQQPSQGGWSLLWEGKLYDGNWSDASMNAKSINPRGTICGGPVLNPNWGMNSFLSEWRYTQISLWPKFYSMWNWNSADETINLLI